MSRRRPEPRRPVADTREVVEEATVPLWLAVVQLAVLAGTFFALFWLAQRFVIDPMRGVPVHDPQQLQQELLSKICPPGGDFFLGIFNVFYSSWPWI